MYNQIREDTLFLMFYASVAMLALIACCYLLFRRANAIAPDVTPPVRLRRWTAVFFAAIALCHLWYLPMYFLTSPDEVMLGSLIAGWLDCMTVIPLMIIILLTMLQDRRRPLWPVCVIIAPLVVGLAWYIVSRSDDFLLVLFVYFLLMWLGIIIYMVRAIRQYGRWLRDNYADLEHKEVWQSVLVLVAIVLMFGIYIGGGGSSSDMAYEYIVQVCGILLIGYLLWRVETLSDLQPQALSQSKEPEESLPEESLPEESLLEESLPSSVLPDAVFAQIELLLQHHCIDTKLYLQHDLTAFQLAQALGSNRTYLSQYFARKDTTYNAYINDLRINYFVSHYCDAAKSDQSFTAQQLAYESGYRSYSTFSLAFKQRMGESVTVWMRKN